MNNDENENENEGRDNANPRSPIHVVDRLAQRNYVLLYIFIFLGAIFGCHIYYLPYGSNISILTQSIVAIIVSILALVFLGRKNATLTCCQRLSICPKVRNLPKG